MAFALCPPLRWLLRGSIYTYLEQSAKGYLNPTPQTEQVARQQALDHLRNQVHDPLVRQALTPDYQIGCKRVLISNDYLPMFNRPNVELVTARIREATATGLRFADGRAVEVDCIVFGTGFRVSDPLSPLVVTGREGRALNDEWAQGGRAYLGISVHGFPNMFLLMGPNTGLGHNSMIYMIETQVNHAIDAIRLTRERRRRSIEVRAEVLERFDKELQSKLEGTVWSSGCNSWYVGPSGRNASIWPDHTYAYRRRAWRVRIDDYQMA
jgi:cation diffusion facilitator CzcD-associated flavoprotein CzcO